MMEAGDKPGESGEGLRKLAEDVHLHSENMMPHQMGENVRKCGDAPVDLLQL